MQPPAQSGDRSDEARFARVALQRGPRRDEGRGVLLDLLSRIYGRLIRRFLLVDASFGDVVDEMIADFTQP